MKRKVITYVLCIILVEAAGFAVGMLTRSGTQLYADTIVKPLLAPPGIVFPIAWSVLYALMGIGLARIILADASAAKTAGMIMFFVQFALNLAWCFIFFGALKFVLAFIELILMLIAVVIMTVLFKKSDKAAALLQIPYIIWLCFAAYLNIGVIILN